jgi:hypothetical protein
MNFVKFLEQTTLKEADNVSQGTIRTLTKKEKDLYDDELSDEGMTDDYILENKKQLKQSTKDEMFEYYKKNKNLDFYYYQNDDAEYRRKLGKWTLQFYQRLNNINNQGDKTNIEDDNKSTL